jgi:hypothetical protein
VGLAPPLPFITLATRTRIRVHIKTAAQEGRAAGADRSGFRRKRRESSCFEATSEKGTAHASCAIRTGTSERLARVPSRRPQREKLPLHARFGRVCPGDHPSKNGDSPPPPASARLHRIPPAPAGVYRLGATSTEGAPHASGAIRTVTQAPTSPAFPAGGLDARCVPKPRLRPLPDTSDLLL